MSRIHTKAPVLAIFCVVALWGCNWLTGPRRHPQPKQGVILEVDRHKATLYINDLAVTLLDSGKPNVIGLEPGTYRVEIRKAGYFSRYYDITVTSKTFQRIKVQMPPELD